MKIEKKQIDVLVTSDGKEFSGEDMRLAIAHQTLIDVAYDVDEFISGLSQYKNRTKKMLCSVLIDYLIWVEQKRAGANLPPAENTGE